MGDFHSHPLYLLQVLYVEGRAGQEGFAGALVPCPTISDLLKTRFSPSSNML
jgi:hypothetical protein